MLKGIKTWLNTYALRLALIVAVACIIVIGVLVVKNINLAHDTERLTTANAKLKADVKSRDTTIASLEERELQNKQIEDAYDKILDELKTQKDGPVADVLRHALDSDVVR